ncbi:MAG: beta-ketoacyl synthase N-terminal-like domain-containing protein [Candidatus Promineifilaceae bacterium]|nr:beta-ketoacyl synthase N-terminal-like domain-containing protein [Candidatus Promineifilaceae bacterium]
MRRVAIVGTGQVPVRKKHELGLRELGAAVIAHALGDTPKSKVEALYLSNMLSDELQSQKHLAALVADEAGLAGVEAIQVRAATAAGAAALRVAVLAVGSGAVDLVLAVGVEKMSAQVPTAALAKALDARSEVPEGKTLLSQNALLMALYLEKYGLPPEALTGFSVNAHLNARNNPYAMFSDRQFTAEQVAGSRLIYPPLRLLDCSPVSDGAAAVLIAPLEYAFRYSSKPVEIRASAATTARFRINDRKEPLHLDASTASARQAFGQAGIERRAIDFFEVHDAFSIMACLILESTGFADPGRGWELAAGGEIGLQGNIPISTMGGLKARGHPIGATALYQSCEIVAQLNGRAGLNQLDQPRIAMLQSVGGAGTTVLTHIFSRVTLPPS